MPCGASPVTCSKSVALSVGKEGEGEERITLTRGQQDPLPTTRLQVSGEGEERITLSRGQKDPLPTARLQVRGTRGGADHLDQGSAGPATHR